MQGASTLYQPRHWGNSRSSALQACEIGSTVTRPGGRGWCVVLRHLLPKQASSNARAGARVGAEPAHPGGQAAAGARHVRPAQPPVQPAGGRAAAAAPLVEEPCPGVHQHMRAARRMRRLLHVSGCVICSRGRTPAASLSLSVWLVATEKLQMLHGAAMLACMLGFSAHACLQTCVRCR